MSRRPKADSPVPPPQSQAPASPLLAPRRRRDIRVDCCVHEHEKLVAMRQAAGPLGELFILRLWCYVGKHDPVYGRLAGAAEDPVAVVTDIMSGIPIERAKARELIALAERFGLLNYDAGSQCHLVHQWYDYQGRSVETARIRAQRGAVGRWGKAAAKGLCFKHKPLHYNESCFEHDASSINHSAAASDALSIELEPEFDAPSITQTAAASDASSIAPPRPPPPLPRTPSPPTPSSPKRERAPAPPRPSLEEWLTFCRSIGWDDAADAEGAFDHYEACGWVIGKGKPVKCWEAAARNCHRRGLRDRGKSQGGSTKERRLL